MDIEHGLDYGRYRFRLATVSIGDVYQGEDTVSAGYGRFRLTDTGYGLVGLRYRSRGLPYIFGRAVETHAVVRVDLDALNEDTVRLR